MCIILLKKKKPWWFSILFCVEVIDWNFWVNMLSVSFAATELTDYVKYKPNEWFWRMEYKKVMQSFIVRYNFKTCLQHSVYMSKKRWRRSKKQTRSRGYESEENRGQSWLGKALVQSNKDVLHLVYMIKSVETISFYFPSL